MKTLLVSVTGDSILCGCCRSMLNMSELRERRKSKDSADLNRKFSTKQNPHMDKTMCNCKSVILLVLTNVCLIQSLCLYTLYPWNNAPVRDSQTDVNGDSVNEVDIKTMDDQVLGIRDKFPDPAALKYVKTADEAEADKSDEAVTTPKELYDDAVDGVDDIKEMDEILGIRDQFPDLHVADPIDIKTLDETDAGADDAITTEGVYGNMTEEEIVEKFPGFFRKVSNKHKSEKEIFSIDNAESSNNRNAHHHGCCVTTGRFRSPRVGHTAKGQKMQIVQLTNFKQYFYYETTREVDDCKMCQCKCRACTVWVPAVYVSNAGAAMETGFFNVSYVYKCFT